MVIITCAECKIDIDVESKRFKMCPTCSRQRQLNRCKRYKAQNRETIVEYNKNWKLEHKDDVSIYNKEYNIVNRTAIQKRQTKQHRDRRKTDMAFKMASTIRSRLHKFYTGQRPVGKMVKMVNMSMENFVKWIESNFTNEMTWKNHGSVWHIDHVVPCAWFDLSDPDEQKTCFHWANMRPLCKVRNLARKCCTLKELLNQELLARVFAKDRLIIKPLVTKLLKHIGSGSC